MAAMIRMIATTISNSIREKPFCFFMMLGLLGKPFFVGARARLYAGKLQTNPATDHSIASQSHIHIATKHLGMRGPFDRGF
jgi:hypothetical protein